MTNQRILHFTLGPVQGFVAQARRTRDLWTGSFLLSYLAGQAMYAVIKNDGNISFPAVGDKAEDISEPLLKAIIVYEDNDKQKTIEPCTIGSLPNRFKAKIPEEFHPDSCVTAVKQAWQRIAQAVWAKYIEEPAKDFGLRTRDIWQRQVEQFWDMAWVVGEGNDLLDRRKNWRSHVPSVEPGDKCSIMGNLQELSGYCRCENRDAQDRFWDAVRERVQKRNLREDERLCAITLIKRMFPEVAKETIGYPVPDFYPSTTNLAAAHWTEQQMKEHPEKVVEYVRLAGEMGLAVMDPAGKSAQIACLDRLTKTRPELLVFSLLDGELYYEEYFQNKKQLKQIPVGQRKKLQDLLKDFKGKPASYYAVLLMDGDSLGSLLQTNKDKEELISKALAEFSRRVPEIVQDNNGVLLYAGGDDVLALLPMEDAVKTAARLRQIYQESFQSTDIPAKKTTISAAIMLSHHHAPLKRVLQQAHILLDDLAKDRTGRDSLAIQVWRAAGPGLSWAAPWKEIWGPATTLLEDLVRDFAGQGINSGDKSYNSTFFYNLKQVFELFTHSKELTGSQNLQDLLIAEYLRNRDRRQQNLDPEEVKERMGKLLQICRVYRREAVDQGNDFTIHAQGFTPDGALLVRFLAKKGVQ